MNNIPSTPLPEGFEPSAHDVVIGKGKKFYFHPGNQWLRDLVAEKVDGYRQAVTKSDKSAVISGVVDHVVAHGKFVKLDPAVTDRQQWIYAEPLLCREKVSQTFRDNLAETYRSSNVAKRNKRRREQHTKCQAFLQRSSSSQGNNANGASHILDMLYSSSGINQGQMNMNMATPFPQDNMKMSLNLNMDYTDMPALMSMTPSNKRRKMSLTPLQIMDDIDTGVTLASAAKADFTTSSNTCGDCGLNSSSSNSNSNWFDWDMPLTNLDGSAVSHNNGNDCCAAQKRRRSSLALFSKRFSLGMPLPLEQQPTTPLPANSNSNSSDAMPSLNDFTWLFHNLTESSTSNDNGMEKPDGMPSSSLFVADGNGAAAPQPPQPQHTFRQQTSAAFAA